MNSAVEFGTLPRDVKAVPRPAAYVVVQDSSGLVATVRSLGHARQCFWLPGGGIEAGETARETIIREVREELGRDILVTIEIGQAKQFFFASDENCWFDMDAHFFAGQLASTTFAQSEFELHWIDPLACRGDFFHECHVWAVERLREICGQQK